MVATGAAFRARERARLPVHAGAIAERDVGIERAHRFDSELVGAVVVDHTGDLRRASHDPGRSGPAPARCPGAVHPTAMETAARAPEPAVAIAAAVDAAAVAAAVDAA